MKMKIQIIAILSLISINLSLAQEKGIINNGKSPYVKLRSVNLGDCQWTEGFWADKFKIAEKSMVPYMGSLLCGDTGITLIPSLKLSLIQRNGNFQISYFKKLSSTYIILPLFEKSSLIRGKIEPLPD